MASGPPPSSVWSNRSSMTSSCSTMSARLRANSSEVVSMWLARGGASRVRRFIVQLEVGNMRI